MGDPASSPRTEKPLMVFDGDCHFCRHWIERWREATGDRVEYAPFQVAATRFPHIPREEFEREVKLIEPDGRVYGGAEAVFRSLNHAEKPGLASRLAWGTYERTPAFARATGVAYRFVARHRTLASRVTRLLWGNDVTRPTYRTARMWFLRALGVIYFIAFLSLRVQVDGLVGSKGILPFAEWLGLARGQLGAGPAMLAYPCLCWFLGGSDDALHFLCDGGMVLSALLVAGVLPGVCLLLLWAFYLSMTVAGQVFLSFQWDILLLETGFLSIFLAPWQLWPRRAAQPPEPSRAAVFLLRWLLVKLMLMSGVVKLTSGDDSWGNLSALYYHYETQPLPTWIGWYAHATPHWFQGVSVVYLFLAELIAPFFVFGPRRVRLVGFALLVSLQILIAATGNYGFFNLLTIALCLLLLDDKQWPPPLALAAPATAARPWRWRGLALAPVTVVYVLFGALLIWTAFHPESDIPRPLASAYAAIEPFRSLNGYGLFRVMTRERPELVLEGSNDAEHWLAYEFKWKPGDVNRPPAFVAPYMPRLDWQMWFAALGGYEENMWVIRLGGGLLDASPPVLGLLGHNPFPDAPPRYVRALLYRYHFTDLAERRQTGAWWRREYVGPYCPVLSLREQPAAAAPATAD